MDEFVEKAFNSLAVTCNQNALHSLDEDRIKVYLRTLYENEVTFDKEELELYLVENGWASAPIKNILKWAEAISSGGRVQLKNTASAPSQEEVWERLNS